MAERRPLVLLSGVPAELPDGDVLPLPGEAAELPFYLADGSAADIPLGVAGSGGGRDTLTEARTYYVATTGSDSNDGLSSGSPFATIQKAVDVVCSLDLSIYQATIQLADGTYTAGATLKSYVGALPPIIQGNATTPANVVLNVTGTCVTADGGSWAITNCKLQATSMGLRANIGASIFFSGVNFGACFIHVFAAGGFLEATGNYAISGAAIRHISCGFGGRFFAANMTLTITGTPAFSDAFAYVEETSVCYIYSMTFSGSATGKRYNVRTNALLQTYGGGSTYLPGNVSGTTATGGQYA
jgi:hypothetical protein